MKIILAKTLASTLLLGLVFTGCTEEKKVVEEPKKVEVQKEIKKVEVKKIEETSATVVSKASEDVIKTVSKAVKDVSSTISVASAKVVEKSMPIVEQTTKDVVEGTKKVIADVSKKIDEATTKPTINAKALFMACGSCHGQNGEKAALGKSQIIKGWSKDKAMTALNGYKDGSYGGVMKGVMKGQVASKSDAEIEALSVFISNL